MVIPIMNFKYHVYAILELSAENGWTGGSPTNPTSLILPTHYLWHSPTHHGKISIPLHPIILIPTKEYVTYFLSQHTL